MLLALKNRSFNDPCPKDRNKINRLPGQSSPAVPNLSEGVKF